MVSLHWCWQCELGIRTFYCYFIIFTLVLFALFLYCILGLAFLPVKRCHPAIQTIQILAVIVIIDCLQCIMQLEVICFHCLLCSDVNDVCCENCQFATKGVVCEFEQESVCLGESRCRFVDILCL